MTLSREKLKAFFKTGSRPTLAQFSNLIDSALIMEDEGFQKTRDDGLRIITKGDSNALLTFGRRNGDLSEWGYSFGDGTGDRLELRRNPRGENPENPPVVELSKRTGSKAHAAFAANVSIGQRLDESGSNIAPQSELDVRGTIRCDGRIGREISVPADGQMHAITPTLQGCVAFEIMAGVGLGFRFSGQVWFGPM
jgi:hypothetical protein